MSLRPVAILSMLLLALPAVAGGPRLMPLTFDVPTLSQTAPTPTQSSAVVTPPLAKRASPFSAGPGGPLLILNETLIGGIAGGVIGAPHGRQAVFGGAVIGGLLLGGAGAIYQYYVPVGQNTALMSTIGAAGGLLAGMGIGSYAQFTNSTAFSFLLLGTAQAGALAAYVAGYGVPDISMGDFGLTAMSGAYATLFGLLFLQTFAQADVQLDYRPVFFTPAAGLLVGGLLSTVLELHPGRILKMIGIPMLTGAALYYTGTLLAGPGPIVPAVTAVAMAVTLGLTAVFTSEPSPVAGPTASRAGQPTIVPTVVLASTRQQGPLAAGPGLLGTF